MSEHTNNIDEIIKLKLIVANCQQATIDTLSAQLHNLLSNHDLPTTDTYRLAKLEVENRNLLNQLKEYKEREVCWKSKMKNVQNRRHSIHLAMSSTDVNLNEDVTKLRHDIVAMLQQQQQKPKKRGKRTSLTTVSTENSSVVVGYEDDDNETVPNETKQSVPMQTIDLGWM